MWLWCLAVLALSTNPTLARSDAQVLITNRGVPAPFPHFPSVNPVPAVEKEDPAPSQFDLVDVVAGVSKTSS